MYKKILLIAITSFFFLQGLQECRAQDEALARIWMQYATQVAPSPSPSPSLSPLSKEDVIRKTWEKYMAKAIVTAPYSYPGRSIGEDASIAGFMEKSAWRYRGTSYELYFASSRLLARSVYGLAIHSGDVDKTMPLERFEKGVRGFHYTIRQLCGWIDAVLRGDMATHTSEERQLILWLVEDRAVRIVNGQAVSTETIHHILGSSPGKKRSFELTLMHERLHVLWDEDPAFAETARKKWAALTDAEKGEVRKTLAAYAQSNEPQLMEEWAIYQAENMPEAERKRLIGL